MIHTHSLGRAARYYPEQTALVSEGKRLTFRELHDRVENVAAALSRHGFRTGDRLAILLPNEPEYIQIIYACAWLGVIAVPLNTADELITHCRQSLANYKVPRRVEFSEIDLPKNGSGKMLKRMLRDRFWTDQQQAVA